MHVVRDRTCRHSLLERLRRNIENPTTPSKEACADMGDRLYHVPGGNIATYGTQKWDPKKARTSWDPDAAAGVLSPAEIVNRLRSSASLVASGCWMSSTHYDHACQTSGFWVPSEKLKGIRILVGTPSTLCTTDAWPISLRRALPSIRRASPLTICSAI